MKTWQSLINSTLTQQNSLTAFTNCHTSKLLIMSCFNKALFRTPTFSGFIVFLCFGISLPVFSQNWYNTGWSFRKSHTITGSAGAGTNYQVRVIAHKATGTDSGADIYLGTGTNVLDDFSDVRFTAADGTTLLDYWLETGSLTSGSQASFWVEVSADLGSDQTIYVYYGNTGATTTSNGTNTFPFFDDFTGSILDAAKWTKFAGGTPTFNAGLMSVPAIANDPSKIIATAGPTGDNYAIGARFKATGGNNTDERAGVGTKTNTADGNGYNYVLHNFLNVNEIKFLDDKRSWGPPNYGSWVKNTFYTMEAFQNGNTTYGRQNYGTWNSYTWTSTPTYTGFPSLNIGSFDATVITTWDWAYVRKCIASEPAHGAWGTQEVLGNPLATTATNQLLTSFSANWNAVPNATGYRLDVSTVSTFTSLVAGYNNLDVGNVLTKSVTGLTAGTTYYYRIRAYKASGSSGNSNSISVTTLTTGDYRSAASGNWGTLATWERFNGTSWIIPTAAQNTPTNASGAINIRTGHTVTVAADVTVDQVVVETGGQITIAQGNRITMTIANGPGTDMSVSGTLLTNSTENTSGITTTGTLVFNNGGTYQHNDNGEGIPTATWASGSTCLITGITANVPTGLGQAFSNLTWNCISQTGNIDALITNVKTNFKVLSTGSGSIRLTQNANTILTIGGSFQLSAGTLDLSRGSGNLTMNVAGDFTISGGTLTETGSGTANTVNFNGTLMQAYSKTGGTIANTINFAILSGATVNFGTSVLDGSTGTFNLNAGGGILTAHAGGISASGATGSIQVTGTRTYATTANYTFNGAGAQVTGNGLPLTVNSLTVSGTPDLRFTNSPSLASPMVISNSLIIISGAKLTLGESQGLTVNGTSSFGGTTCFELKSTAASTASFIHNGPVNGTYTAKVNRYVSAANWATAGDGWHLLSSPVGSQGINGAWTPSGVGNDYDFYALDESKLTEYWLNQKVGANAMTSFVLGKGYLVAYQQAGAKSFTGALNSGSISVTGLTNTAGSAYPGYHLVGNPFASAINWNTGTWTKTNIDANAYVWKNGAYTSTAVTGANIIPAMNGFMVHVSSGAGALTIPLNARVHSATSWYKSAENDMIILNANDKDQRISQSSIVRFNPGASPGYDTEYDSYFVSGFAPMFYSVTAGNSLLLNTLPEMTQDLIIPFSFLKNNSGNFSIELAQSIPDATLFLEDKKTGEIHNLTETPVYSFTSAEGDDIERFQLRFMNLTSVPESSTAATFSVNQRDGIISITTGETIKADILIANMLGQVVLKGKTNNNLLTTFMSNSLQNGVYVVSLVSKSGVSSTKILINR